jgi:hypothetical protein
MLPCPPLADRFTMDESVLYKGAALHAGIAMEYLKKNSVSGKDEL